MQNVFTSTILTNKLIDANEGITLTFLEHIKNLAYRQHSFEENLKYSDLVKDVDEKKAKNRLKFVLTRCTHELITDRFKFEKKKERN